MTSGARLCPRAYAASEGATRRGRDARCAIPSGDGARCPTAPGLLHPLGDELEPLFAHASTRARPQDWAREQVWRICKLAGVPKVGPHGLRGTHATIADTAGATPELVAATLGHASTGITTGGAYIDRQQAHAARRRRTWQVLDGGKKGV